MSGSKLTLRVPSDFDLARDVCSYGYFLLWPNLWDVRKQVLWRTLHVGTGRGKAVLVRVEQRDGVGSTLRVACDCMLDRQQQHEVRAQLTRMLRLDEDEAHVCAFHEVDSRWRKSGRARLFRSPTLFEDVIKTVTSCNVAWPSTVRMNQRLCEVAGVKSASGSFAFPAAVRLARMRPGTLRGRCGVGYRDRRIVDLAQLFVKGEIEEAWLCDPATSDQDVFVFLKELPGIGPYSAANIMQLLGRYSRLPVDTETIRHGRAVLGMEGTDRELMTRLHAHYERFCGHAFRSYWFELWDFYEEKKGLAWTWDRQQTAAAFTASKL